MGAISEKTALTIARAHQEIRAAEELLKHVNAARGPSIDEVRDGLGRRRGCSLGYPMSSSSERLFDVSPDLAVYVIQAHVAAQHKALADASIVARMELDDNAAGEVRSDG